jgi:hypothetical protein
MKNNLYKLKPIWFLVLFVISTLFTHLPFFIYTPIPSFSMDTYGYFWVAQEIQNGNLPISFPVVEFPVGYSLIIFLIKSFGGNLLSVVIFQFLVYLFSGIFFIFTAFKGGRILGISAALSMVLFSIIPSTIAFNYWLYTESFFTSILVLICASIISYMGNKTFTKFLFLLVLVLFGITLRSNGLILLFIPIIIVFVEYYQKKSIRKKVLSIFLVVFLPQIILNYFIQEKISFSESSRISKVISIMFSEKKLNNLKNTEVKEKQTKKEGRIYMYRKYFSTPFVSKPSYYFSILPVFYENEVIRKNAFSKRQTMFDTKFNVDTFAPKLKNYMFSNSNYGHFSSSKYINQLTFDHTNRNMWMYLSHLSYEVLNKMKIFYILTILYWFGVFYYLYKLIRSKEVNLCILLIIFIHVITFLALPYVHGRFQGRYLQVCNFIVYFISIYFLLNLVKNYFLYKRKYD